MIINVITYFKMSETKNSVLKTSFKIQKSVGNNLVPRPEILLKLKCKDCDGYLSSAPIYLNKNGEAICGKCSPEKESYRNTSFETLAEMISFPCSNQRHGCREIISFLDTTHEYSCEYRQYLCPLLSTISCEWLGPGFKVVDHCISEHNDVILTNPCVLKHDLTVNSFKNFLILAFKTLFLIHTKVCITSKKIYHSIRLIGDPKRANNFNFNLDIENNGATMNKMGKVVEQGCLAIQEKFCTVVSFNSLNEFLGSTEGVFFKIKLNHLISETLCYNCKIKIETTSDNNNKIIYCEDCINFETLCENSKLGCTYKDIRTKTEKHKRYFCKYTSRCIICKKEYNMPLEQHYLDESSKDVYRTGSVWQTQRENTLQWCIVKSLIGVLICAYRTAGNTFKFYVCSVLNSYRLSGYRCILVLTNPVNGHTVTKDMDVKLDEIFDWKIQICDQEFLDVVDNNSFCVTVNFNIIESDL